MVARFVAVSLHDVAPSTWPQCEVLLRLTDAWKLPVSLLVVPNYHRHGTVDASSTFAAAVRARVVRGDEAVLHGYAHLDESPAPRTWRDWWRRRVVTAGEGEMAAIDAAEARERLRAGLEVLEAAQLTPAGFIPPAWLMGEGTREALRDCAFAYTSSRDELYALPAFTPYKAPSLVYSTRSAWRRALSFLWNERRRVTLRDQPLVRIALHPGDADHPAVLRHWRGLLAALLSERSVVLESRWLAAHAGH